MNYTAKVRGIRSDALVKDVGPSWGKVLWGCINFDNFPKFNTHVGTVVHTDGTTNGNFITREAGVHRFKGQIYIAPPTGSAKVSLYLAVVRLGTSGAGFEIVQVVNEEIPSGQHPSLAIDTMIEAVANEYFAFFWYYLDSTGTMKKLTLQADPIYCFAEVEKLS